MSQFVHHVGWIHFEGPRFMNPRLLENGTNTQTGQQITDSIGPYGGWHYLGGLDRAFAYATAGKDDLQLFLDFKHCNA